VIWQEPPVVLDAKYHLGASHAERTYGPIKKLLGDMSLLFVSQVVLFFPLLPEPEEGVYFSRAVKPKSHHHHAGWQQDRQILLYELKPNMLVETLQNRLRSVLDHAEQHLPERSAPICEGIWLDADSFNASGVAAASHMILCPKRHIGAQVFDLVDAEEDCLKNPKVCHVIGQAITRPEVIRVTTRDGLLQKSRGLRARSDSSL
jgi:hypothetical protein